MTGGTPLYGDGDRRREVIGDEEEGEPWRSPFGRDYGRVIHSASFRRLHGKTQVFPGHESDFFRNRLTHSLEVAQIAEGIAERLNHLEPGFQKDPINPRICATAALIHDIGHPPFGHNGERALDEAMRNHGGFEGNAQTLRIVSRLEKKVQKPPGPADRRAGLNLTFRTLAGALKYDRTIPAERAAGSKIAKGYYESEKTLVAEMKAAIIPDQERARASIKTVECAIMDIADDIAYSTYDLEDCLKAGFVSPASILASEPSLLDKVAAKVSEETGTKMSRVDVIDVFVDVFSSFEELSEGEDNALLMLAKGFRGSRNIADSAYLRTKLSTQLVHDAINQVQVVYDDALPMLSVVRLNEDGRMRVEVLKHYTFQATIYSARVKLAEYRGFDVVSRIFGALAGSKGDLLMPEDVRELYSDAPDRNAKQRVVCDFVAGMTDRYALEFYARLHSDSAQSMFKPI